jgi:hypothetical protein
MQLRPVEFAVSVARQLFHKQHQTVQVWTLPVFLLRSDRRNAITVKISFKIIVFTFSAMRQHTFTAGFSVLNPMNFFKLYAAAANKTCLWAKSCPLVYIFFNLRKCGSVPRTGSTVAARNRIMLFPARVCISRQASP